MTKPALQTLHRVTQSWFIETFGSATQAQTLAWPVLARGESALLLSPTGSGKTLAAFLLAVDRLVFAPPAETRTTRVLYTSPLKALAVDVERNLQAPLAALCERAAR